MCFLRLLNITLGAAVTLGRVQPQTVNVCFHCYMSKYTRYMSSLIKYSFVTLAGDRVVSSIGQNLFACVYFSFVDPEINPV